MFDLVIKPFKSNGVLYERGTVITDPSSIRRYVLKVREGKILQVNLNNERIAYKFNILTQRYNLDKNGILTTAGLLKQPSATVVDTKVDYENMTPAQKSAYTKKMKKLATMAEQQSE